MKNKNKRRVSMLLTAQTVYHLNKEAELLTDAGVLVPCAFCKGDVRRVIGFGGLNFFKCKKCGAVVSFNNDYYNTHKNKAITAWNTRAPILSKREVEMLNGKENP